MDKSMESMNDQVAILIPTYNRDKFIIECIKNARAQTHPDTKIIVYNDGSSDRTHQLISFNAELMISSKFIYEYNPNNNGIVYARNRLLAIAKENGIKYGCWQDSDDLSHPERVARELEFIKETGKPMVLAGWTVFRNERVVFGDVLDATNTEIIFASGLFEIDKVPQFREIKRHPTPTTLGGEDVVWRTDLIEQYGQPPELRKLLYYVRRHPDRISVWRKSPTANPDWHKRMSDRVK
jgi:glycosyltransferase involved in cell wall biosynthesis